MRLNIKQPHSWKEYTYRYANDNDSTPRRMWIRDSHKIHETETGEYITAHGSEWRDTVFKTFEEADKSFANDA